jgi:hypothetical protein
MAGGPGGGYRDPMTSVGTADERRPGALMTVLGALWSARTWRVTLHALVGLPIGVGAGAVIVGLVVVWFAAVWSLFDGPTGGWGLAVVDVVVAAASPIPLLWCV